MLVVVLWMPTLWVPPSVDIWQLVINAVPTIITLLLVALLSARKDRDGLADALWDLMGELGDEHPELRRHRPERAVAVALGAAGGS